MNHRLKELRESLGMSQKIFSERILVGSSTLAMWELGTRTIKDIHISKICTEFNVSEEWLRNGIGEMFVELPEEDEYSKAAAMLIKDNDEMAMKAVIEYWKLDNDSKKAIWEFVKRLSEK